MNRIPLGLNRLRMNCWASEKRASAAKAGFIFCCIYGTSKLVPFQRTEFFGKQ